MVAISIGRALLTLAALAPFYLILNEGLDPMVDTCKDVNVNASATQACTWTGITTDNYLAIVLAVVVMGVIVGAAYRRQGGF